MSTVPPATHCSRVGRFFTRWEESDDGRAVFREGGRAGDVFYRDRWSHDKVVRSTHGVNCTGSCSWKVYVKDGIITWETQQTDYPSVGPDRPGVRAARLPARCRVLLVHLLAHPGALPVRPRRAASRCTARPRSGSATRCWPGPTSSTTREAPRRYQQARGKGGLVRVSWAEAVEIIAAAHVHTIKTYGPDRIAGFSPIPAMSMVSHCVGTRFIQLIGGVMTSFYDWYADLPVASPQVFGDQTDVPESGDWWDATYLMMWGSNVPVTRTPDAHWMAEVRYRGTKVVTVSPDYADNTKFADEWLPAQAGTDAALAMAMGHVILKEFFVDRRVPFFTDYVQQLHRPAVPDPRSRSDARRGRHAGLVPGKFLTAADLGRAAAARGRLEDRAARRGDRASRWCRTVRWASATPSRGVGRWNLDLEGVAPALTLARRGHARPSRCCCRASTRPTAPARCCAAACRSVGSAATSSPPSST